VTDGASKLWDKSENASGPTVSWDWMLVALERTPMSPAHTTLRRPMVMLRSAYRTKLSIVGEDMTAAGVLRRPGGHFHSCSAVACCFSLPALS
jgi:hypothetical protein